VSGLSAEALGALAGLGSALTWAVTSLLVRTLVPPFQAVAINAIRAALSGVLLLGVILLTGGARALTSISGPSFVLLIVSIVAAIGVGDTVFFDSTRRLGLGRAMSISMTYPVVAALLAITFMDERVTPQVALGSALTLGGLLLIVGSRGDGEVSDAVAWRLGVAGAAVAAVAWGVSAVLMKAPLREVDAVTAQAVRLPIASAILFATPWARGAMGQLRASEPATVWRIAVLSLLTAVSSVMYVASLKYAGVTVATVLSSTAPLFAIPLGLLCLGERLSAGPVLGAVVAVAGIAVLQR
jgi:drug/metabolite transporter (DMT)-like permease